jgi:hypothetical protein
MIDNHPDLADFLFLLAAVLFVVEAVAIVAARPAISRGILLALGLASVAVALFVL